MPFTSSSPLKKNTDDIFIAAIRTVENTHTEDCVAVTAGSDVPILDNSHDIMTNAKLPQARGGIVANAIDWWA
jgi:hypothetical protein